MSRELLVGLVFVTLFLVAANVRADYVYSGLKGPGCREIVHHKTTARHASKQAKPVSSLGKSKSAVYLSLAQALSQSQEFKTAYIESRTK